MYDLAMKMQWHIAFSENMDWWFLMSLIHSNATRVKLQWCMKEFSVECYTLLLESMWRISPMISLWSYQEHSGIKDYFLISFSIQAFYIH